MTSLNTTRNSTSARLPSIFIGHGSPMLLEDADWVAELKHWASTMVRPQAILMISAHWETQPLTLGATAPVPLVYDFWGFPRHYYSLTYPAPGAPALASRVTDLVSFLGPVRQDPERGLDHGAYLPLIAMYPEADIPVLQISLPTDDPKQLFALGQALAPLRDEGVLIIGSGFLSHNLALLRQFNADNVPDWAIAFDDWIADVLQAKDIEALLDYRQRAPGVRLALPTHEHFLPVIVALGAAAAAGGVSYPITGFTAGAMTKRSVQFD